MSRLLWLPVHFAIITLSVLAVAARAPWPVAAVLSVAIGHSFACLTFLAHEVLHGSVVRSHGMRKVIGWLCFLPFTISPRLWIAWHNREHHGHTMQAGSDPDAYPTLAAYQSEPMSRFVADRFTLGRGHVVGFLSLFVGFSVHSTHMAVRAHALGFLSRRDHLIALLEKVAGLAVWVGLGLLVGGWAFLAVYVIPLLVANAIVLAYIFTNHSLSPMTDTNDPLANSLSVTVPRWLAFTSLSFGYHVEHPVFPSMSPRHARRISAELQTRWPDRYQSMPLVKALRRMLATARVYKNQTTLCDPRSGREWPTLGPAK
jgi:fatty acid desaturase